MRRNASPIPIPHLHLRPADPALDLLSRHLASIIQLKVLPILDYCTLRLWQGPLLRNARCVVGGFGLLLFLVLLRGFFFLVAGACELLDVEHHFVNEVLARFLYEYGVAELGLRQAHGHAGADAAGPCALPGLCQSLPPL